MEQDREALEQALRVGDETERLLEVAAVVEGALHRIGVHPVVVGGLAVAYWTAGAYVTGDIDVVMPHLPEIDTCLAELGFEKRGRFWVLPGSDVFLEAPGSFLASGEEAVEVDLESGRMVTVLRAEDVLVYRLHEFVATGHGDSFRQSVALLGVPGIGRERLAARVAAEGLADALEVVQSLADRVATGGAVESWELHDIARRLHRGG